MTLWQQPDVTSCDVMVSGTDCLFNRRILDSGSGPGQRSFLKHIARHQASTVATHGSGMLNTWIQLSALDLHALLI
jgi:hypothetical protein